MKLALKQLIYGLILIGFAYNSFAQKSDIPTPRPIPPSPTARIQQLINELTRTKKECNKNIDDIENKLVGVKSGLEAQIKALQGRVVFLTKEGKRLKDLVNQKIAEIDRLLGVIRNLRGNFTRIQGDSTLIHGLAIQEISKLDGDVALLESTVQDYTRIIKSVRDTLFVKSVQVLAIQKKTLFFRKFANKKMHTFWNNQTRVKASRVKTLILTFDIGIEYPNPHTLYYTFYYRREKLKSKHDTTGFKVLKNYKDKPLVMDYLAGKVTADRAVDNPGNQRRSRLEVGYKFYNRGKGAQLERLPKGAYKLEIYYKSADVKQRIASGKGFYVFYLN